MNDEIKIYTVENCEGNIGIFSPGDLYICIRNDGLLYCVWNNNDKHKSMLFPCNNFKFEDIEILYKKFYFSETSTVINNWCKNRSSSIDILWKEFNSQSRNITPENKYIFVKKEK